MSGGGGEVRSFTLDIDVEQVVGPRPTDEQITAALQALVAGESFNFSVQPATRPWRARVGTIKVRSATASSPGRGDA